MPEISRFFGIVIQMYYRDHQPPHFHATYGEFEAVFAIGTLAILEGALPIRARGMVREWAELHRAELSRDWTLARQREPLESIEPLE